ncbi:zinc finger protein RFP-like isoform X1 [Podarcis raffonei]|uniref:zinc finger protein RFP-like isoform X1 n=1 Tax=Podarcis raffonei TaxID=65483 RepID=UPI0023293775|nr:zinc finger protein RFP-like isoform X1 [Podarcis raffonei]
MAAAAAAGSPVQDLCDEATCSICLEYFKDPVTTAECGHNFCRSCLVQCCGARGRQASCPQCRKTVQKGNLIPNRQLAHLVELIKKLSLEREEEEGRKGGVCEKHQEPLNLFCEDHESPICVVCEKSKMHENHKVIPLEEAFEEYKGLICSRLEILMKEKEKIMACQADLDKESQDLLKLTETGRQKTVEKFRQLQQFLKEQEKHHLDHIEEVEKEVARKRNEQLARLSRELAHLEKVVQEMEKKRLQPANELLQDVRSTLQRYEKRETLVNPLAFPPELKGRISEFCDINPLLEDLMKQFKDALLLREQLQEEVLSFGKPQKEGQQRAAMEGQDPAGAGAAEPRDPLNELQQYSWQLESQLDTLAGALGEQRLHLEAERTLRATNVTLDPDTAYLRLILSEDRKSVRLGDKRQALPDNPERFNNCTSVLGREGFTAGRHFWEVTVGSEGWWTVGVARKSVKRRSFLPFSPEGGIWAVEKSESKYWACTSPDDPPLSLSGDLKRIRVTLDYEEGRVSFFDADSGAELYTFSGASFSGETLLPFFCLGGGKTQLSIS